VSAGFRWGNLRERSNLEDLDVEDSVIWERILQYKPTKCIFYKLIFYFEFFYVFYVFRNRGFIFRKTVVCTGMVLCVQVWYCVSHMHQCKRMFYIVELCYNAQCKKHEIWKNIWQKVQRAWTRSIWLRKRTSEGALVKTIMIFRVP
jgi:hypothetical protein